MSALLWVDGLIADFCNSFSGPLREEARRLPYTLGFAREPFTPWSRVFNHEVTLAAPALVGEAMPGVRAEAVKHALIGHALAVIEAMGTDRIEDGQVVPTPALCKVLGAARSLRDEHLVLAAGGQPVLDPGDVDREFNEAMMLERDLLVGQRDVDFRTYESISKRKQVCGILGVDALAVRAGWDRAAGGDPASRDPGRRARPAALRRRRRLGRRRDARPLVGARARPLAETRAEAVARGPGGRARAPGARPRRPAWSRGCCAAVGSISARPRDEGGSWAPTGSRRGAHERANLTGQLAEREALSPGFVIRRARWRHGHAPCSRPGCDRIARVVGFRLSTGCGLGGRTRPRAIVVTSRSRGRARAAMCLRSVSARG